MTIAAGLRVLTTILPPQPFSQPWTAEDAKSAPPRRDWAALLGGLRPGVTGKTINGVYTGTEAEASALAR